MEVALSASRDEGQCQVLVVPEGAKKRCGKDRRAMQAQERFLTGAREEGGEQGLPSWLSPSPYPIHHRHWARPTGPSAHTVPPSDIITIADLLQSTVHWYSRSQTAGKLGHFGQTTNCTPMLFYATWTRGTKGHAPSAVSVHTDPEPHQDVPTEGGTAPCRARHPHVVRPQSHARRSVMPTKNPHEMQGSAASERKERDGPATVAWHRHPPSVNYHQPPLFTAVRGMPNVAMTRRHDTYVAQCASECLVSNSSGQRAGLLPDRRPIQEEAISPSVRPEPPPATQRRGTNTLVEAPRPTCPILCWLCVPANPGLSAGTPALPAGTPLRRPPGRPSCSVGGGTATFASAAAPCPCPVCSGGYLQAAPQPAGALGQRAPAVSPPPPRSTSTTGSPGSIYKKNVLQDAGPNTRTAATMHREILTPPTPPHTKRGTQVRGGTGPKIQKIIGGSFWVLK